MKSRDLFCSFEVSIGPFDKPFNSLTIFPLGKKKNLNVMCTKNFLGSEGQHCHLVKARDKTKSCGGRPS